ncbi:hypothetical protein K8Q94_01855 [Candidatus Nomurabacteria bacterium]|nr:hypothetical protein [Candidatus Nomurabacteria bacterium]
METTEVEFFIFNLAKKLGYKQAFTYEEIYKKAFEVQSIDFFREESLNDILDTLNGKNQEKLRKIFSGKNVKIGFSPIGFTKENKDAMTCLFAEIFISESGNLEITTCFGNTNSCFTFDTVFLFKPLRRV